MRQLLPPWEALFVIKLLIQYGIYPPHILLDGLDAWRRLVEPMPFIQFLVQKGGLPVDTATQAVSAGKQAFVNLRDRIGFDLVKRSRLLGSDQLAALARDPLPAGLSLTSALVQRRVLSGDDGRALEKRIDASLGQALGSCITSACQRYRAGQPAALEELEGRLQSAHFGQVYRATVEVLLQQLG